MFYYRIVFIFLGSFLLFSCQSSNQEQLVTDKIETREDIVIQGYLKENKINALRTDSGIYYYFLKNSTRVEKPSTGDSLTVHYTGSLIYGKIFDSSRYRDVPFGVRVGAGKVIKGWEEALMLLRAQDRAIFILPSRWAYGAVGSSGIPANSVLVFDIEVLNLTKQ